MIAVKGRHARRHVVHTLDTCSAAIVNRYKPQCTFFSITHKAKYAYSVAPSPDHTQTINTHCNFYTQAHTVIIFSDEGRIAKRVGSVLLKLCGVLQQVFICQFSGCRCPALLKTSPGISWRCHGLDTTSHTYALTRVSVRHKSHMIRLRYLSPKRVVTVKNTHVVFVCFDVCATLDLFAESWFLCVRSAVGLQAYNSPLCRQSRPMCFAVACGVVVLKWWLRERVCLACMSLCLRGSSSRRAYLLFSALFPVCLSVCLSVAVCTPVCLLTPSLYLFLCPKLPSFCSDLRHLY